MFVELLAASATIHLQDHPAFRGVSSLPGGGSGAGGQLAELVSAAVSGDGPGQISVRIFEMLLQT